MIAWSRTQRSIALSSCECEYLASVGGGAEAHYIAALWEFLVSKPTQARIACDSSSCRAFSQRQGVGRLRHINVKYLWLQQKVKDGALELDAAPTVLNIAKRLARARRAFLMFFIGLVQCDSNTKSYAAVGEDEFNAYLQKKAIGKTMKSVRQVMLASLFNGMDESPIQLSKPMVKAVTIMALQPLVGASRADGIDCTIMVQHFELVEVFMEFPWFMLFYGLTFLVIGIFMGYYLKKATHVFELNTVLKWATEVIGQKQEMRYVDGWDPERHELRQCGILRSVDEAESGEEYFRECPGGLASFVKLDKRRRAKYGFSETDPLNAFDLTLSEDGEEEGMEVDELIPPTQFHNQQIFMDLVAMEHIMLEKYMVRMMRIEAAPAKMLEFAQKAIPENTWVFQVRLIHRMNQDHYLWLESIGTTSTSPTSTCQWVSVREQSVYRRLECSTIKSWRNTFRHTWCLCTQDRPIYPGTMALGVHVVSATVSQLWMISWSMDITKQHGVHLWNSGLFTRTTWLINLARFHGLTIRNSKVMPHTVWQNLKAGCQNCSAWPPGRNDAHKPEVLSCTAGA